MNTTNNEKSTVWQGVAINERSLVWQRIAIVTLLLVVLVGPNFGPLPHLLRESLSLESSITGVLIWFLVAFMIILAVVYRMAKSTSIREFLITHGLGAPSGIGANIAGLILGIVWGLLFLSSILQFDPDANLTQINSFRILTALLAAGGALLEDLITRSFIMNQLHKIGSSKWVQVVISALIFALYHTIWGFNPFSFVFSMVYGLLLGGLFLWGKRSLTPVILGHSLVVLIAEPFATMLIFLAPGA
ncbi:MAG TPA: CPBP family glutamic-type intramembrane protease [Anaerolineales bacterium]|nr:CPBP family glutamic-type intramembrane protease [Anaerolineales bacterium]